MISVLVPFASNDPRRVQIFEWVKARWENVFPNFEVCVGTSDPNNFSRSHARNEAFAASTGDTILVTDADTACPVDNVLAALYAVEHGAPWIIAHQEYYSLTEAYTDVLLEQASIIALEPPFPANWVMRNKSQAGVLVMPRAAYESVGGYDERFIGWGYEDNAFAVRLDRAWGYHSRVPGPMLHLWHDPGENFQQPFIDHNKALFDEEVAS